MTTVDRALDKAAMARATLERAGLAARVTIVQREIVEVLRAPSDPFDLVFLDADRESYLGYLGSPLRLLRPGGLLATGNVVSHAFEVEAFLDRLRTIAALETLTLPVGNGVELTYRRTRAVPP